MRWILTAIRILVDAVMAYIIYQLYNLGVEWGVQFFKVDFWFTRLTFGIIGVGLALALFSWVKHFMFYIVKCCEVYVASTDLEDRTLRGLFSAVIGRFGSVITIPIFNKVIRSSVSELGDAFFDSVNSVVGGSGELPIADIVYGTVTRMDGTLVSRIAKAGKTLVSKMFDYVDECVLSYCFINKEESLPDATVKSVFLFIKSMDKLVPRMFTACITSIFLKAFLMVISAVVMITLFGFHDITALLVYYVGMTMVSFVIEDAIIEPMMMYSIVHAFSECATEFGADLEECKKTLFDFIPSLEGITKMNILKGQT